MNRFTTACMVGGLVAPLAATAESVPTLGKVLEASGFEVSGYVDTSYTYSKNGAVSQRTFDTEANSFNLNMLGLTIAKLPETGLGGKVVLNAGSDANVTAAAGTGNTDEFDVQQGYVSYATGASRLMFGKYATMHGAEVIESKDNLNFSRSILFGYAIPFTHTGVRWHYSASDTVVLGAGVNNGWDNLKDNNKDKSVELMVGFAPSDLWSVSVQGMVGKEDGVTDKGDRSLVDVVADFNATEDLSFKLNLDYGTQKNGTATGGTAKWQGVAGYANYQLASQWRVALRGEYFNDKDGFRTGTVQKWKEGTLTLAYAPVESVELRGELRHDWSDQAVFANDNGGFEKSQNTVGLEAIYMF